MFLEKPRYSSRNITWVYQQHVGSLFCLPCEKRQIKNCQSLSVLEYEKGLKAFTLALQGQRIQVRKLYEAEDTPQQVGGGSQ